MTDQQTGGIPSGKASNDDTDDEHRQRLQWILEQARLRYSEIKDKSNKLMNQAARLLGYCAISGFTTFLPKSTWADLPNPEARDNLKTSIKSLMNVAIAAAVILAVFSIILSLIDAMISDPSLDAQAPDIAEQVQRQSSYRRMTLLIQKLRKRTVKLKVMNLLVALALYALYTKYAFSLADLVKTIISSH